MKTLIAYLKAHRPERIFITIWCVFFLIMTIIFYFVHPLVSLFLFLFVVIVPFAVWQGAQSWGREQQLIKTGMPVWATVTERRQGRNGSSEVVAASVEMEYQAPDGTIHPFSYKSRQIRLSEAESKAREVLVIVNPKDWNEYYVDWTKTDGLE